ncbi:hypothetical protein Tco_0981263 [Tanacetum coccineum]
MNFKRLDSGLLVKSSETQFQMFINSQIYLNDEYIVMTRNYFLQYTQLDIPEFRETLVQFMEYVKKSIDERALHKMEYDSRVNERQTQTTEEKIDTSNALDALDARQQHTEQPESNNEGEVDQNADQCYDTRPLPAKLTDNTKTELSFNYSEFEIISLTNVKANKLLMSVQNQIPFTLGQQWRITSMLNTLVYNAMSQNISRHNRPSPIAVAARTHEVRSANIRSEDSMAISSMHSVIMTTLHVFPFEESNGYVFPCQYKARDQNQDEGDLLINRVYFIEDEKLGRILEGSNSSREWDELKLKTSQLLLHVPVLFRVEHRSRTGGTRTGTDGFEN